MKQSLTYDYVLSTMQHILNTLESISISGSENMKKMVAVHDEILRFCNTVVSGTAPQEATQADSGDELHD